MARKLEYSILSLLDLAQMRRWLSQPGAGPRAKARAGEIAKAARDLRGDPVQWPKGDVPGTRQRIVRDYTIVYAIDPDTDDRLTAGDVYILRVYGPGQKRP